MIYNNIIFIICCYLIQYTIGKESALFWSQNGNKRQAICPDTSDCVPLTSCPLLNNILNNQCVDTEKIAELGCGYGNSGMVCCPQLIDPRAPSAYSPGKMVDGIRCGQSQVLGEKYEGLGAYPWAVRIGFRNVLTGEIKYPCTGSIINKRVILTSAHCALARAEHYKLFIVKAREWNTASDIDCGDEFCSLPSQDIPINHVILHPGFQKNTYVNNIALLVLRTPINYTVTAQPICLPDPWSVTNFDGILIGWGKAAGQRVTPNYQQVLHLPIKHNNDLCKSVYGNTLPVNDEQLCAGGDTGNDACSGFGGAPLFVRHGDTHYQVGILSFGSDQCGAHGVPSVYTNIKKYSNWIQDNLPKVL